MPSSPRGGNSRGQVGDDLCRRLASAYGSDQRLLVHQRLDQVDPECARARALS